MNSVKRNSLVVLLAAALMAPGAVAGNGRPSQGSASGPRVAKVTIDNFRFTPAVLTVTAGTVVTWTNRDDMPHTVVSTDKSFASQALDTGDTFTYTFENPGTFDYLCSIHPRMTGRVVVKDK